MKRTFPAFTQYDRAVFRITETKRRELERVVFHRHPDREWGTFFRFGYRRTSWGLALSFVDLLPPKPGELDRNSPIVSFRPDYISRAADELERQPLGIGIIHSHPLAWGVSPSPSDDDMDMYYARLFEPYGNGRPYLSLIANRSEEGQFVFSGRAFDRAQWVPVDDCFTPGHVLERHRSLLRPHRLEKSTVETRESITARWESLVGSEVRERFAGAVVGVVGCSGTGSPAVEALARAQIGEFVLVDEQRLAMSNIERMHGSRLVDVQQEVPPYKTEVLAKLIREVNPNARITMLAGNVLDETVLDELLRCDVILGCTDTLHARACLGDLAALYLLPCIDVGVLPRGNNGRILNQHIDIMRLSPSDPCPFCRGRINPVALSAELMPEEERQRCRETAEAAIRRGEDGAAYWSGDVPQLPTVGYLTTAAGALAAGYALNWLLGTAEMPHAHFQFDIGAPEFGFVSSDAERRLDCTCGQHHGFADQGDRSVTLPRHFARAARLRE